VSPHGAEKVQTLQKAATLIFIVVGTCSISMSSLREQPLSPMICEVRIEYSRAEQSRAEQNRIE